MSYAHRRRARSVSARAVALGAVLFLGVASCSDGDLATAPMAPAAASSAAAPSAVAPGEDLFGISHVLFGCTPLPVTQTEALIGPAGGTMQIGPHTFVVPAGALGSTVRITAHTGGEAANSVDFAPEGLRFAAGHPARLTLSYANCALLSQLFPKRIAYTTDLFQVLELLVSIDQPLARKVSADIVHFSRYAVAW